jgi:thiamine biosynthesis protein ThiI
MTSEFNTILCRYCEIALKGGNRLMFEHQLMDNISRLLSTIRNLQVKRTRGRMCIERSDREAFTESELNIIRDRLPKAFGLASFSPGISCRPDMTEILDAVKRCSKTAFDMALDKHKNPSFRVRSRRSDKTFPFKSKEVEIQIAELVDVIHNSEKRLRVDLENADITIGCEIRENAAFIFLDVFPGPGGLPVGCNSPVLALLSGGIDSPVACSMLMKRGCHVDFITFHSSPYTPPESLEKVERIVKVLNTYQQTGKLFACNIANLQKQIRDKCSERFRTVLYRRFMFRIAESIAEKNRNAALLTGESVGQVASQTIINLSTIDNATKMLVLRPLAGMDKEEVIRIARKIGTYDLSAEQVPDSCTVFAPKSPSTSAPLDKVSQEELRLDVDALVAEAVESVQGCRGQRAEDRGRRTEDRGQRTEDRGQRTEDRGQRTEDRGQRTEGGGRRAEDRGQRTEGGNR